jgi:hypothetical protein
MIRRWYLRLILSAISGLLSKGRPLKEAVKDVAFVLSVGNVANVLTILILFGLKKPSDTLIAAVPVVLLMVVFERLHRKFIQALVEDAQPASSAGQPRRFTGNLVLVAYLVAAFLVGLAVAGWKWS